MTDLLLLMCGIVGLWMGSETLIKGAMSLADRYRVSDAMFGMLVLAIGTDLPELFIAVDASLRSLAGEDLSGIVIGSAIGSSVGQFALVFGVAGFIGYETMNRKFLSRNAFFLIGSIAAVFLCSYDGVISRLEGIVLCMYYASYFAVVILQRAEMPESEAEIAHMTAVRAWLILALGLVVLMVAAELTVVHAVRFAERVGLSNIAVSAIIIGMGSSLPELSVSFIALLRKRGGLSVGNLIGSNILDTLLVPGVAAVIAPLIIPAAVLMIDLPVLLVVTSLVLVFLYVTGRGVRALEASVLLAIYIGYVFLRLNGPGS